jgi:hypothetical protein
MIAAMMCKRHPGWLPVAPRQPFDIAELVIVVAGLLGRTEGR